MKGPGHMPGGLGARGELPEPLMEAWPVAGWVPPSPWCELCVFTTSPQTNSETH